jgi:hypothetical protein
MLYIIILIVVMSTITSIFLFKKLFSLYGGGARENPVASRPQNNNPGWFRRTFQEPLEVLMTLMPSILLAIGILAAISWSIVRLEKAQVITNTAITTQQSVFVTMDGDKGIFQVVKDDLTTLEIQKNVGNYSLSFIYDKKNKTGTWFQNFPEKSGKWWITGKENGVSKGWFIYNDHPEEISPLEIS